MYVLPIVATIALLLDCASPTATSEPDIADILRMLSTLHVIIQMISRRRSRRQCPTCRRELN
jgi:hypothetical protein